MPPVDVEVEVLAAPVVELTASDTALIELLTSPTPLLEITAPATAPVVELSSPAAELVLEVQAVGARGPRGPAYEPLVYVQSTPASSWPIPHGLGRTPGVTIVIDGRVEYTEVTHPDLNNTLIVWPVPTAGRAELF